LLFTVRIVQNTNTLCGCNAEVWNVQAGGAYSKLSAIEGY